LPGIAPAWQAGLLFDQDGQIDNRRQLMRALESACVDRGVHFQEGVEVLNLLKHDGRLHGVRTRDSEGHAFDFELRRQQFSAAEHGVPSFFLNCRCFQ